jgi:glycosyltransferase involved in cell wall biosynthesis
VIPSYNESQNLPKLAELCNAVASEFNGDLNFILVNNGSTDDSDGFFRDQAKAYQYIKFVSLEPNRGYGAGILTGLIQTTSPFVGWMHADLQTSPMELDVFLRDLPLSPLSHSVFMKGFRVNRPLLERVFTAGMSIAVSCIWRRVVRDINGQPTIMSRDLFEKWSNPPEDFSLDMYAYYIAQSNGASIYRTNVQFGDRLHGRSSWNISFMSRFKFSLRNIEGATRIRSENQ